MIITIFKINKNQNSVNSQKINNKNLNFTGREATHINWESKAKKKQDKEPKHSNKNYWIKW